MFQTAIIGLLLTASMFYLGRMVHKAFLGKASCGGGCAKCAVEKTQQPLHKSF